MASSRPRTCATPSTAGLLSGRPQEQLLDGFEMPAVGEKQDHVIVGAHDGVMVGHDDLFPANHGADDRAFGEWNLANRFADHA